MINKGYVFLVLFVFFVMYANTASSASLADLEQYTTDLLECGIPIESIAERAVDRNILNVDHLGTNTLRLLIAVFEAELQSRNEPAKEVVVPAGVYTVGIDIPAGEYSLSFANNAAFHFATVKVYDESGKKVVMHTMSNNNIRVGKLALEKGQTVEIASESIKFTPYEGLGF